MDQATVRVPSSTANAGRGYDIWAFGVKEPYLDVTCMRTARDVEIECYSPYQPPESRVFGYTAKEAVKSFLAEFGIEDGVRILFNDSSGGYPAGGLGRSGAEIVGALASVAALYGKRLTRERLIDLSNRAEGHPDNVAASVNGKFNIMTFSPFGGRLIVDRYPVHGDFGLAIGFSSHKKTGGTEAGRRLLRDPLPSPITAEDFVSQTGAVSMLTGAIINGNIDNFLELIWDDTFHEPRRADAGFYGNFSAREFFGLKRRIFSDCHAGLCVSGAGPNMQLWYDKREYPQGADEVFAQTASQFRKWGIDMNFREVEIAESGAYDYAAGHYSL